MQAYLKLGEARWPGLVTGLGLQDAPYSCDKTAFLSTASAGGIGRELVITSTRSALQGAVVLASQGLPDQQQALQHLQVQ